MCGFVGLRGDAPLGEDERRTCRQALELVRHRGPDHVGFRSFERAELAHARLAILDPEPRSHQPLRDTSGRWWCVLNGEIYNFLELRRELEGHGHRFATRGDTEVVLEAYKAWGRDCQRRFNGMWAFAIYDAVSGELFLSRDRCGVRPLYVARLPTGFGFASEMKALLALGADSSPDWVVLSRYLQGGLGDDGGDATVFRGVRAVPPGHDLTLSADGTVAVPRRWWSVLAERETAPARYRDRVELLREGFRRAVALRLRSDVATGVALSGGLDSSSVYGAARELETAAPIAGATSGRPMPRLRAFTVSNPGTAIDERPWVDACIARWGEGDDLEVVVAAPERLPDVVDDVVWHQEAPVWSPTVVAVHELYRRAASRGVRVMLEGHGADELLGGYVHHAAAAVRSFARSGRRVRAWRAARCWQRMRIAQPSNGRWPAGRLLAAAFPEAPLLAPWRRFAAAGGPQPDDFRGLVGPEVPHAWSLLAGFGRELDDPLERALHLDFARRLPGWFRIFDRAAMASGVETRVPFTDPDVVRLGFSLPPEDKVGSFSKRILRDAAGPWLPRGVRRRRLKQPFAVPWSTWLENPSVRGWLLDTVRAAAFRQAGYLDGERAATRIEEGIARGLSGAEAFGLWPVVNLHLWHGRFVSGDGRPPSRRPSPGDVIASDDREARAD